MALWLFMSIMGSLDASSFDNSKYFYPIQRNITQDCPPTFRSECPPTLEGECPPGMKDDHETPDLGNTPEPSPETVPSK